QLTTPSIISADIFLFHHSWITSLKAKIRDYPSGLEPDLKSRKTLIYLSYYTLTYRPLTSILHTPHAVYAETGQSVEPSSIHNQSLLTKLSLQLSFLDYMRHRQLYPFQVFQCFASLSRRHHFLVDLTVISLVGPKFLGVLSFRVERHSP